MAVHTYIGARYVPRFMGTYDPTQIYEALDVVDNGSGTSYIARDIVPAGTPLTDTNHWFVYGASSGAIIALQNDMIQAQNDIGALQGDMTTAQGDIADNTADIATLKEPKIIYISDSYGSRVNGAGKTISDKLVDFGRDLADIRIVSGGSFAATDPAKAWINYVDLYSGDKNAITDVYFCGSVNDASYSYSDIKTAAIAALNKARTEYPNAKIHVVQWGVCFANSTLAEGVYDVLPRAYQEACDETGAIYVSNAEYMLRNSNMLESDRIHPNGSGVDYVAGKLNGYILGSAIDVFHQVTVNLTAHSGGATIANLNTAPFVMTRHNGSVTLASTNPALSSLEFDIATPASGFINLGFAIDTDATLVSYPTTDNKHIYQLNGYGRTSDPKIHDAKLNIKFAGPYVNMTFIGSEYGTTYNKFFLTQYMLNMLD